ncbi:MAG: mechanosensitive ion channel family protein [Flavobacteriaceae bacterium]|nr:mechanosensitive ion channel family protein [Flavobacteriaceae bacterium]
MKNIFLLGLFMCTFGFAQQPEVKAVLNSPYATVYTHLYFLQPDSYQPNKAALTIYGFKGEKAIQKAIKLKKILDGKGLRVVMDNLPKNDDFIDTTSVARTHTYVLFPNKMPEIYLEKIKGKWYYSEHTIAQINNLYAEVYPWGTEFLKSIIPTSFHKSFLGIELWQYLGFILLVFLSSIVFYLFKGLTFFVLRRIEGVLVKNTSKAVNEALNKLSRPITLLFVFWFFERTLPMLQLPLNVNSFLFMGIDISIVIFWIYVFLKLVSVVMQIYAEIAERTDSKLDDQLVPILNNMLRVLVYIVGVFNLLKILGVDTTALIAGASIGGLALAFASQDTVKNLIGTFMIFLDKPFQIGDWIEAGSVVGTVEEVGFRSTRVRAADTSLYQIPNSSLSEMVVNNKGLRLYRRYNTKLGLRYDTPPELIEAFVDGVRAIIKAHPATRSDAYNVEFTGFGDSALLVLMNTYFISLGWNEEQSAKHKLHLAIVKLAKALGVDFAFPSTTVIIEQFPEKNSFDMKYQTDPKIVADKIKKVLDEFKKD